MSDSGSDRLRHETRSGMERAVGNREQRRLRARRAGDRSVWFGLGMFGVVGWSIAVPMVLGIALGLWIDSRSETERSWTLMLMAAGLGVGCLNAWAWVSRESRQEAESQMNDEREQESAQETEE